MDLSRIDAFVLAQGTHQATKVNFVFIVKKKKLKLTYAPLTQSNIATIKVSAYKRPLLHSTHLFLMLLN